MIKKGNKRIIEKLPKCFFCCFSSFILRKAQLSFFHFRNLFEMSREGWEQRLHRNCLGQLNCIFHQFTEKKQKKTTTIQNSRQNTAHHESMQEYWLFSLSIFDLHGAMRAKRDVSLLMCSRHASINMKIEHARFLYYFELLLFCSPNSSCLLPLFYLRVLFLFTFFPSD